MVLRPDFPSIPLAILAPSIRWFSVDEASHTSCFEKRLPPLVPGLRKQVKACRDSITATRYLNELVGIGLLMKRKIGRDNYYINTALYDMLGNVHQK